MNPFQSFIDQTPWAFQGFPDDKEALHSAILCRPSFKGQKPFFSLITPLWNTPEAFLEDAIKSCLLQTFPDWELILVDDGSTRRDHLALARKFALEDPRIRLYEEPRNSGISMARNKAVAYSRGNYICILDHDDLLHPYVLAHYFQILHGSAIDLLFCNEVKIDSKGKKLSDFFYKPAFDYETLLRSNYIAHFAAVKAERVHALLAKDGLVFDAQFDGVEDHQYFLRLASSEGFVAVNSPVFGYYWRKSPTSTAEALEAKPYVRERLCKMLEGFAAKNASVVWPTTKKLPIWTYEGPSLSCDVHVWGKDVERCIGLLQNQIGVKITDITSSLEDFYYPRPVDDKKTGGQDGLLLVLHSSVQFHNPTDLSQLLGFMQGADAHNSVSPAVMDRNGLDRGDWTLALPQIQSWTLPSDFAGEQRLGVLPSALCVVMRRPPRPSTPTAAAYLDPCYGRCLRAAENCHFYFGSVVTEVLANPLPLPQKISILADGAFEQTASEVLNKHQMSYDPNRRWTHSSPIADDWLEVPLRYRLADALNSKAKNWLRPFHNLVKPAARKGLGSAKD